MRTLFNIISAKPLFFIIIGLSLLTGIIYYAVSVIKTKKAVRKIIIFICSGILAMLVTVAVCNYVALLLSTEKFTYKPVFSIFYAFCFFPPIAFIFQKALRIETDFEPYVTPIMLSIGLSRIACLIEGCCGGTINAAHIECLLCLGIAVYNMIKKDFSFGFMFVVYLVWRFAADFFKETFKIEALGPFTSAQYLCLLSVMAAIIVITMPVGGQQNEK
ncbi:MAG: hypothetical protein IKD14_02635 [Clostridia bacterium]|nr:hypothetical protein [Clostridia bacterium]